MGASGKVILKAIFEKGHLLKFNNRLVCDHFKNIKNYLFIEQNQSNTIKNLMNKFKKVGIER